MSGLERFSTSSKVNLPSKRSLVAVLCAFITAVALGIAGAQLLAIPFLVGTVLIALIIVCGWLLGRVRRLAASVETMRQHALAMGTFETTLTDRLNTLDRAGQERDTNIAALQQQLANTRRDLSETRNMPAPAAAPPEPHAISLTKTDKTQRAETTNISKPELKSAIRRDALALHLQPIVDLPSRKPKHFQVSMRMQNEDGAWLNDAAFSEVATAGRLWPQIDRKMLFAAVRIQRRLGTLKKRSSLLCPISEQTLANKRSFEPILQFAKANQSLGGSVAFLLDHEVFERITPAARERLGELVDTGFHIALNNFTDFEVDADRIASHGIRFVLAPAQTLLRAKLTADNEMMDWTGLGTTFSNSGISLIVTQMDDAESLPPLFDCAVTLASGPLFAEARPVRDELNDEG